jgi:hypothetical protein
MYGQMLETEKREREREDTQKRKRKKKNTKKNWLSNRRHIETHTHRTKK